MGGVLQVVFSAILGASLGSFFNVAAHRSVTGRPWWGRERSVCESCGKELSAWELVPLVSWVLQRGRCRSCGARISLRYLVVEVVGAAAAGLMAWRWGLSWAYVLSMTAVCGFLINSLTDYESGDVFDAFALMTGLAGLAIRLAGGWGALLDGLVGVVAGWGLFAAIILSSRLIMGQDGMGWGDACFMGGMGAVYGWKMTLLAFYMGIMCGGVGSLWLLFRGKVRWGRHDAFALVPYLSAGGFLTLLFGPWLLGVIGLRFQYFPLVFQTGWPW